MSAWAWLASTLGDTWWSGRMLALWPWPAVIVGSPHSKMLWSDYRAFTRLLQPGDMFMTQSKPFFASNAGISGSSLKHLVVYVGAVAGVEDRETGFIEDAKWLGADYLHTGSPQRNVHERCVCEAISEGVVCRDMGAALMHSDYAVAVRPWGRTSEQAILVETALANVGKPYGFDFDESVPESIHCTELGVLCLKKAAIIEPLTTRKWVGFTAGRLDVTLADSFVTKYPVVCCSESCLDPRFQAQSALGAQFADRVAVAWSERGR